MAANFRPIWSRVGSIGWATLTSANTATDGTGTVSTVFTADSANGSYVESVSIQPLGTNVQTVVRFFVNNGSSNTTATNNALYAEVTMPATTGSNTDALGGKRFNISKALPPGYKINCTIGTAVSAGLKVVVLGGDY